MQKATDDSFRALRDKERKMYEVELARKDYEIRRLMQSIKEQGADMEV